MFTKKAITLMVAVSSIALLAGCGGAKTTTTIPTTTTTTGTATDVKPTRDLSNTECIELVAYAFKAAQYQAQGDQPNFMKRAQKTADLQTQYKMNDAQYESSCGVLMTNPTFMQTVQKRMAELK